ncbi:MAG: tyrosine--tRNA ligase [Alphaproteobacteria bacterium]|nr:tyrosine--tRNA ligase [Alphaproteobacteria bacterium]MDD9919178.1 tyrosine--tRNA ligase [Alphaproteobacteria bacterium]
MNDIPQHILAEAQRQHDILSRGTAEILGGEKDGKDGLFWKLVKSLQNETPLKVKFGMDPTAPDIHLGHTVVLTLLRRFQDLGHVAMPLIGDYTCRIGDPSGRNKTRPPLTGEEIDANAKTYFEQAFKVLSKDEKTLDLRYNGEWLKELSFADTIKLCAQVTVARIIEREDFTNRLQNNVPISMHELLYPIMQGYDSVAMECDIELGGTDQTFNCLMGRHLMQVRQMNPQIVITMPLLEGTDGVEKMSKSKNNYIGVHDEPNDMFGKVMSIPDNIMNRYFELLTDVPLDSLPEHPMDAKKMLGRIIVERFHHTDAAQEAQTDFETRFSQREVPQNLPEKTITENLSGILEVIVHVGFAESNSKARQLIKQNAVKVDGTTINDHTHEFQSGQTCVLQVGRRQMMRLTFA